jgi:hypothetical protein
MAINYSRGSGDPSGLQIIDPVLSNVARQFTPHGFIYNEVVAMQPVEKHIGQYPVFDPSSFFGNTQSNNAVADDAVTPLIDIKYSEEFYRTKNYRLKTRLTNEEINQGNAALRLELSKVRNLMSNMAVQKEIRLATELRSVEAGGQLSGGEEAGEGRFQAHAKWNEESATIQADLQKAKKEVRTHTGITPNALLITQTTAENIANNKEVKELIRYVMGPEYLEKGDRALPPYLFGLKVMIADGALANKANIGAAFNPEEIWGKGYCRVCFINSSAGWGDPTTVYSFRGSVSSDLGNGIATGTITQQEPDGSGDFAVVDRWVEPDPPAQNIRAWENVTEKVVAPELGIEIYEIE